MTSCAPVRLSIAKHEAYPSQHREMKLIIIARQTELEFDYLFSAAVVVVGRNNLDSHRIYHGQMHLELVEISPCSAYAECFHSLFICEGHPTSKAPNSWGKTKESSYENEDCTTPACPASSSGAWGCAPADVGLSSAAKSPHMWGFLVFLASLIRYRTLSS